MQSLFVTCPRGFEPILKKELLALGIRSVREGFCGVSVPADPENVYLVNYESRTATRVLYPIVSFPCPDKEALYGRSKRVDWSRFLDPRSTFAVDANVSHPNLTNSLFAALVVKDAICDFFREKTGARPSVDKQSPDVQLNLFIQKGEACVYLDTSGDPLHKRGWRETNTEATLHESIAAALLLHTGYTKDRIFCDPFCGSGTFLVEAALIATDTPPGFLRKKWGFFRMPGFNRDTWKKRKFERDAKRIALPKGKIFGSDKSREAADTCKRHVQKLGFASSVEVRYDEIAFYNPPSPPDYLLTNPPYGKRLEVERSLFRDFKGFTDQKCAKNGAIHILYPEAAPLLDAGLEVEGDLRFKNGGLSVQLFSKR